LKYAKTALIAAKAAIQGFNSAKRNYLSRMKKPIVKYGRQVNKALSYSSKTTWEGTKKQLKTSSKQLCSSLKPTKSDVVAGAFGAVNV